MLPFGGKKKPAASAPRERLDLRRAFPVDEINEAFRHLLRLINRVAILGGASGELSTEIAQLREDARRATLPEDYEHLCDQVRALEFGSAISALEPADTAGVLRDAIDAAIPIARAMGGDGPLVGLLRLRQEADHPRSELGGEYHGHMERLAESVAWVRAAADVFKISTLDLVATLSRLSNDEHPVRVRLTQLRDGIERAGDLDELHALRHALLQEANALVEEATHREQSMSTVRQQVDSVQAHVATLESALADANQMARTDPLTGLGNRRALEQLIVRLADSTSRTGVVALDIDHFKRVNDSYGHAAGDLVIRRLADVMRTELRGSDEPFRVGGEEFVMILPSTDAAQAAAVADRVRVRFAVETIVFGEHEITCSVSAGAAEWTARQTFKGAVDLADKALYAAKRAGRNRVQISPGR